MALTPAQFSIRFLMPRQGDLRIEWSEDHHDEMVKLIQTLMDQGVVFHIIETPAARRKAQLQPISDAAAAAAARSVFVRDPDIAKVIESGVARIANITGVGELKISRKATSAEDAATHDTVAVSPAVGG